MMRLCFDATKFGGGLDGAIELAAEKGLPAVEYSFAPFKVSAKGASEVKGQEKKQLEQFAKLSKEKNVEIACLSLDYVHLPGDKNSFKLFLGMITKVLVVASTLNCQRVAFHLAPGADNSWKEKFEAEYQEILPLFEEREIKPLLRTSTPVEYRSLSLKKWKAMEPQDWRDLISGCPNLSLSFSPADCIWLFIDYLALLAALTPAIEHIEAHDIEINRSLQRDSGLFGPLWWRYRQIGKGHVDWNQFLEALKLYDYQGTFSIQLDDEHIVHDMDALSNALDDGIQRISPLIRF